MQKNIHLRIANPCSENWDQMHREQQGRFCSSCQTTVVDFTMMSEQEVLNWFAKSKESVCGRFHAGQLNHDLVPRREEKKGPVWFWRYLLAGLLISSEASAQTQPPRPPVGQHDSITSVNNVMVGMFSYERPLQRSTSTDTLRGRLIDSYSKQPIVGATIMEDHRHGTISDEEGYFTVPRKSLSGRQTITISGIGYETISIDVRKSWNDDQVKIIPISMVQTVMGDVVVIAGKVSSRKTNSILKDTLSFMGFPLSKKIVTLYPNPVARGASISLSIRLDKPGAYTVQLISNAGLPVESIKVEGIDKTKIVLLDIPAALAAGTYFVRLSQPAANKIYTQQLVVF